MNRQAVEGLLGWNPSSAGGSCSSQVALLAKSWAQRPAVGAHSSTKAASKYSRPTCSVDHVLLGFLAFQAQTQIALLLLLLFNVKSFLAGRGRYPWLIKA